MKLLSIGGAEGSCGERAWAWAHEEAQKQGTAQPRMLSGRFGSSRRLEHWASIPVLPSCVFLEKPFEGPVT